MFLCVDCMRPPPDPILDIGHRFIGDRENMHFHAFFLITSQTRDSFTGM